MSNLHKTNGDDYPEAARRHAYDSDVLLRNAQFHGAAYLSGYVVECCLKTLIQVETGPGTFDRHDFKALATRASLACAAVGARAAKYLNPLVKALAGSGGPIPAIAAWNPAMRYTRDRTTNADATSWLGEANMIYHDVIEAMVLDGVVKW